ncbi:MAG: flagellar biosynthetic protein FliR [Gammaproteobacteria bacterium]|nr:flagellar biosynthetic protein FliR [Gammaproteobacteria bacterium]
MIAVTEATVLQLLASWMWPFMRIAGFAMTAPVIGTRAVPMRIRLIFALSLTGVLAPVVAPTAGIDPLAAEGLLTGTHQIVVGATIGLVMRLLFFVFEFAGQVVAQQMGLGFASLIDPQTGAQVPVLAQFYIILATLLFFVMDAHLALIALLAESFEVLPIGPAGITQAGAGIVIEWSADLIATSLLLGLPILVALLAINFGLGVMARAAPQLNIFAVGFPVMIFFGVILVFLSLDSLPVVARSLFVSALETIRLVLAAP